MCTPPPACFEVFKMTSRIQSKIFTNYSILFCYLFLKYLFFFLCVCVLLSVCMRVQVPWNPGVGFPEAGLQNIVNLLVWILGVRPRNCTRTMLTLSSLSTLTCVLFLARRRPRDQWRSGELHLHLTQSPVLSTSHKALTFKSVFP